MWRSGLNKMAGVVRVVCRSGLIKWLGLLGWFGGNGWSCWGGKENAAGVVGVVVRVFLRKLDVLFEFIGWFEVTELLRSKELLIKC